jgi:hypothetical protein
MTATKVLRGVVLGLALLVTLMGGAFLIAEAIADPGGIVAVVAWTLPMAALSVYALRRPATASPVLMVAATVVVLFVVLDAALDIVPDGAGPVGAIAVFALAVPLGCLGVHLPAKAGALLVVVGAVSLNVTIWTRSGAALGGSSGAVGVMAFVFGALFVAVAAAERLSHRPRTHLKP